MHSSYFELYRMGTNRYFLRQKLVAYAQRHGIKAAVRAFGASRNTVRKWLRRSSSGRPTSLQGQSRRPPHCPHQISAELEQQIVQLRQRTGFGAERLQIEFELPCGTSAIARVLRQHQLIRPRKKKALTKRRLRAVKRAQPLFGQLSADLKYLQDIPHYWPQMTSLKLPRFQYTVREVVSGATFVGYADEGSKSCTVALAELLSRHLARYGIKGASLIWQTDNGSEFQGNAQDPGLPGVVRRHGADHRYIPPRHCTWQSDVETVHRLVEDEFFDRENFRSPTEFWAQVTTYWYYFNLVRPNRGKEWQSPLEILQRRAPQWTGVLFDWRPVDLGRLAARSDLLTSPQGGHDLPNFPIQQQKGIFHQVT